MIAATATCPTDAAHQTVDEILAATKPDFNPESIRRPEAMKIVRPAGELPAKFPDDAPFALLTVQPFDGYRPADERSGFPSAANGFPSEISTALAETINRSDWANARGTWAVKTTRGGTLLISGLGSRSRPTYPDALPAECEPLYVENEIQARNLAAERNLPRIAVARVPREWTIAVKNPRFGVEVDDWTAMLSCQPNPLADKLVEMYLPVWERIDSDLPYGVCVGGATTVQKDDDGKPFALDDERLYAEAEIRIDQTLLYDLRGDIEGNVAQALREYAHELLDAADRLQPSGIGQGTHLVIERERVVARFDSLAAAGGFAGGYGEHCQLAELVQEEPVAVGKGTEGGADVPA